LNKTWTEPKQFTVVMFDYENNKHWLANPSVNPYQNDTWYYMGKIPNEPHYLLIHSTTGKPIKLHEGEFVPVEEDEEDEEPTIIEWKVGDRVVVDNSWTGVILGFKDNDTVVRVEAGNGNVHDVDIDEIMEDV
jgi:hypothetical protein